MEIRAVSDDSGETEARAHTAAHQGTPVAAWLPAIVERIVHGFQPLQVILFGSQARGEARWDSDVDLLVVLPAVAHKRRTTVDIRRALRDVPVDVDVVVTTPDEIARYGDMVGRILRPALREGRLLYESG